MHVKTGDVLIIPAGVGHFSVSQSTRYEVVGGYPGGLVWDMIYNEPEHYEAAQRAIRQLPSPAMNPLLGAVGIPGWTASPLPG